MRRGLLLLLALLGIAVPAHAEEAGRALLASGEARLLAELEPAEAVHVGERVTLRLELLTTNWFTAAPELPEVDVEGAIVRRGGDLAINGTRRIDGETFASQIWTWWIFPRRAGTLRVPALDVTFFVAGEDREPVEVEARTKALSVVVRPPEKADGAAFTVATPALKLEARWDPEPEVLKVGDAFRRTLVVTVEDVPGMLIEPLPPPRLDGAAVYPDAPRVEDESDRGEIRGRRTESATFVLQRPGRATLEGVRIPWWNVEAKRMEVAEVEALSFEVRPNPDLAAVEPTPEPPAKPTGPRLQTILWVVLVLALLGVGLWRLEARYGDAWRTRRAAAQAQRHEAEPARFERLLGACRAGDAASSYTHLLAWTDSLRPPTTPGELAARQPSTALAAAVDDLEASLYGPAPAPAWDGSALATALAEARRRLAADAPPAGALPPLNPS